jgi:hypothetical protein
MIDTITSFDFREFFRSFLAGDINLLTGLVWFVIASLLSMLGGAIGGMLLARKDLGYQFSAMLGALFGPAGMIPAIILGLIALSIFNNF